MTLQADEKGKALTNHTRIQSKMHSNATKKNRSSRGHEIILLFGSVSALIFRSRDNF